MLGIFLDTETNGLDFSRHRAIEIAMKILDLTTLEEIASYETLISISREEWAKSDPLSLKVNGTTFDRLQNGKLLKTVEKEVEQLFKQAKIVRGQSVFICQNPSFDRPFFTSILSSDKQESMNLPYHWLDLASMYWALQLTQGKFPTEKEISKDQIAQSLGLPPENHPHRAMNGVDHLILIYKTLLH